MSLGGVGKINDEGIGWIIGMSQGGVGKIGSIGTIVSLFKGGVTSGKMLKSFKIASSLLIIFLNCFLFPI